MPPSHAGAASQSRRQVFNLVSAYFANLFDYLLIPHPQRCGSWGGGGTHSSLAARSPFQQHLKRQWSRQSKSPSSPNHSHAKAQRVICLTLQDPKQLDSQVPEKPETKINISLKDCACQLARKFQRETSPEIYSQKKYVYRVFPAHWRLQRILTFAVEKEVEGSKLPRNRNH